MNLLENYDLYSPTNIYSLSVIEDNVKERIFIATSSGIFKLAQDGLVKINLMNISSQANIISICAYESKSGTVLVISYQNFGEKNKSNINFYLNEKFLKTLEVPFTPLQLFHSKLYPDLVFLSGTDKIIHTFMMQEQNNSFLEVATFEILPELCRLPSCALRSVILPTKSAIGCQNGYLRVSYNSNIYEKYLDGPINSICFFDDNLVVGDAIGKVILFPDLPKNKLGEGIILMDSNESVLCINVFDFHANGKKDIFIGTYSELFIYSNEQKGYELSKRVKYKYPINDLAFIDVNKDGLIEMLVLHLKCILIYQPDGVEDTLLTKLTALWK
jgi:hypothetical protein